MTVKHQYQEVTRREQEIAEKKKALDDMKRKNQLVQDKVRNIILIWVKMKIFISSSSFVGSRTDQNPEYEARGAEGRARHE